MSERTAEAVAYAIAAVMVVVGGTWLPSQILNWVVGPAIVVVTVSVLTPVLARRRGR